MCSQGKRDAVQRIGELAAAAGHGNVVALVKVTPGPFPNSLLLRSRCMCYCSASYAAQMAALSSGSSLAPLWICVFLLTARVSPAQARMPVAKFVEQESGTACDVCINNYLAVVNTRLLRDYTAVDKRLRPLVYAVKHWAKRRGVNEPFTGAG